MNYTQKYGHRECDRASTAGGTASTSEDSVFFPFYKVKGDNHGKLSSWQIHDPTVVYELCIKILTQLIISG